MTLIGTDMTYIFSISAFSQKWGLQGLDDFPEHDVDEGRRSRPNTEYDSDILT